MNFIIVEGAALKAEYKLNVANKQILELKKQLAKLQSEIEQQKNGEEKLQQKPSIEDETPPDLNSKVSFLTKLWEKYIYIIKQAFAVTFNLSKQIKSASKIK